MIRTINTQPPHAFSRSGELLPSLSERDGTPSQLTLITSAFGALQSLSSLLQASEERKGIEAQCQRDIRLSDNALEEARIARDKHALDCQVEIARFNATFRAQPSHTDETVD